MFNKLRAFLPPPAVILLIAMCMGLYAISPDDGRQRQVYTTARKAGAAKVVPAGPPADAGMPRDSALDNFLLAGFTAVADSGPLPLAGATAIPLIALFVRRRLVFSN